MIGENFEKKYALKKLEADKCLNYLLLNSAKHAVNMHQQLISYIYYCYVFKLEYSINMTNLWRIRLVIVVK